MDKISTFFYVLDNRDKNTGSIISAKDLTNDGFSSFDDVYDMLNEVHAKPSERVVKRLLAYAQR